jgi:hypothetical protein
MLKQKVKVEEEHQKLTGKVGESVLNKIAGDVNDPEKKKELLEKAQLSQSVQRFKEGTASNNLSYDRMVYITDKRHPRQRGDDGKIKPFSFCGTDLGCHTCSKNKRKSDFSDFGIGVTLYFKMIKFLVYMFMGLSFLATPLYILFYSGNQQKINVTSKQSLSAFTLGNIGQSDKVCDYLNFKDSVAAFRNLQDAETTEETLGNEDTDETTPETTPEETIEEEIYYSTDNELVL